MWLRQSTVTAFRKLYIFAPQWHMTPKPIFIYSIHSRSYKIPYYIFSSSTIVLFFLLWCVQSGVWRRKQVQEFSIDEIMHFISKNDRIVYLRYSLSKICKCVTHISGIVSWIELYKSLYIWYTYWYLQICRNFFLQK